MIKQATLAEFGRALIKSKAPLLLPLNVLSGAAMGRFVSNLKQRNSDEAKGFANKIYGENLVNAKAFVNKHAPDVDVVSSPADVKNTETTSLERKQLNWATNRDVIDLSYLKNSPGKRDIIMTPNKVNKYALAHELGHHQDLSDRPRKLSERLPLSNDTITREEDAWKKSPLASDVASEALKKHPMESYNEALRYAKRGAGIGLGLGALATIPNMILRYKGLLK